MFFEELVSLSFRGIYLMLIDDEQWRLYIGVMNELWIIDMKLMNNQTSASFVAVIQ